MADNYSFKDAGGNTVTHASEEISAGVHASKHVEVDDSGAAIAKAEDAAHSSGDKGVMALAVRKDTAAALAGTDGDYTPLISDASGKLHVADSAVGTALGIVTETAPATDTASSGLNGRLQRIAQRLTSLIALLPTSLGQTTKTASLSVAVASDDDLQAKLGIVTETAPATDTASSGLNGRLQRIAQRLTSLIALLPTSLGAKTAANSLSVAIATDQNTSHAGKSAADYTSGVNVVGAVRNDNNLATTLANFDYTMLNADSTGRLKTISYVTTLAVDDVAAAGELFPAAALYQSQATVDEVDTGDLGRLRMTSRRALVAAPDMRFNQVAINNVGSPGGIQVLTGAWASQGWGDPTADFFDGSNAAFDNAARYLRIPMQNWSQVVVGFFHTLAVNVTFSIYPLQHGYTGADGILAPKLLSVVVAHNTPHLFSPHAGGDGAGTYMFTCPALQMPMTWLLLEMTPASDPASGYMLFNVARS